MSKEVEEDELYYRGFSLLRTSSRVAPASSEDWGQLDRLLVCGQWGNASTPEGRIGQGGIYACILIKPQGSSRTKCWPANLARGITWEVNHRGPA